MASKEPKDSSSDSRPQPHQSPTDMISRNEFLLWKLRSEIRRMKEESARLKDAPPPPPDTEGEADPEKILKDAREQLEYLKRTGGLRDPRPQRGSAP